MWARLSIFSAYSALRSIKGVQGALPSLTHVTIDFGDSVADEALHGSSSKLALFLDAPRLRYVRIRGSRVGRQVEFPYIALGTMADERPPPIDDRITKI